MNTNFSAILFAVLIAISQTSAQLLRRIPPGEAIPPTLAPLFTVRPASAVPPTEATPSTAVPSTTTPSTTTPTTATSTAATPSTAAPSTTALPNVGQCMTPVGINGSCINLHQCDSIFNLLKNKPLLEEDRLYLKRSQCGYRNRTVLVCCPDQKASVAITASPANSPKLALIPQPGRCGTMLTNRLYGGYTTEIDAYRWMALLEYSKGGNVTGHHCGGTLINDRYILTAAHCVTALPRTWSLTRVRLGEWDIATDRDCEKFLEYEDCADPHIDVPIETVIVHENFVSTSRNRRNDIALIRLSSSVNSSDFIQPICLPFGENTSIRHAFEEQSLDLVGWGATPEGSWSTTKERSSVPVIPLSGCQKKYAQFNITLEASQFCVEGRLKNDTCRIDSGGSVISFDTSRRGLGSFFAVGVQSFGPIPCWNLGLPGVYTRIDEYLDWILRNIQP